MTLTEKILAGVSTALLVAVLFYRSALETAEVDILKMKLLNLSQASNIRELSNSIDSQNRVIDSQKVQLADKLTELEKWRQKKPEVRYKTVYDVAERVIIKYRDRNITNQEECNVNKDINNAIQRINFNEL